MRGDIVIFVHLKIATICNDELKARGSGRGLLTKKKIHEK
jgi:hypothetical protein